VHGTPSVWVQLKSSRKEVAPPAIEVRRFYPTQDFFLYISNAKLCIPVYFYANVTKMVDKNFTSCLVCLGLTAKQLTFSRPTSHVRRYYHFLTLDAGVTRYFLFAQNSRHTTKCTQIVEWCILRWSKHWKQRWLCLEDWFEAPLRVSNNHATLWRTNSTHQSSFPQNTSHLQHVRINWPLNRFSLDPSLPRTIYNVFGIRNAGASV